MTLSYPSLPRVVAAAITPCRAKGQPSAEDMTLLCSHLATSGCDGIFILGSTGEATLLDEASRRRLTVAARKGCGSATLFGGASGLGIAQTLQLIRNLQTDGADIAIIMAPYFMKLNQPQLLDYARAIADASPLPVGFYHHLRMPSTFEAKTVASLALHPNIVAFKETSGSLERMASLLSEISPASLAVYQGSEALVLESLRLGAHGSVTALANGMPELLHGLTVAWCAGDAATAQQCQEKLTAHWRIFGQPEVGQSFAHFLQAVYQPLRQRGILPSKACLSAEFQPEFYDWLNHFHTRA